MRAAATRHALDEERQRELFIMRIQGDLQDLLLSLETWPGPIAIPYVHVKVEVIV